MNERLESKEIQSLMNQMDEQKRHSDDNFREVKNTLDKLSTSMEAMKGFISRYTLPLDTMMGEVKENTQFRLLASRDLVDHNDRLRLLEASDKRYNDLMVSVLANKWVLGLLISLSGVIFGTIGTLLGAYLKNLLIN